MRRSMESPCPSRGTRNGICKIGWAQGVRWIGCISFSLINVGRVSSAYVVLSSFLRMECHVQGRILCQVGNVERARIGVDLSSILLPGKSLSSAVDSFFLPLSYLWVWV